MIGCDLRRVTFSENAALPQGVDGRIIANNKFLELQAACGVGSVAPITRGIAIVQNVMERAVIANPAALTVGADGTTQPMDNVIVFANTIVGDRANVAYADVAGASGISKRVTSRFNLIDERNCKTDTFTTNTTVTGRVGNWRYAHNVANDDVVMAASSGGGEAPGVGAWIGEFWQKPTFNLGRETVGFVTDLSRPPNPGGGDYRLTGETNGAYAKVAAGRQPLSFDLAGSGRLNDGSGAAGAYERGS